LITVIRDVFYHLIVSVEYSLRKNTILNLLYMK